MVDYRTGLAMEVMLHRIGMNPTEAAAFLRIDADTIHAWLKPASPIQPTEEQWEKLMYLALRMDRTALDVLESCRRAPERDWVVKLLAHEEMPARWYVPGRSAYISALRRIAELCAAEQISCAFTEDDEAADFIAFPAGSAGAISRQLRSGPTLYDPDRMRMEQP